MNKQKLFDIKDEDGFFSLKLGKTSQSAKWIKTETKELSEDLALMIREKGGNPERMLWKNSEPA